jgi:hypothetical protein
MEKQIEISIMPTESQVEQMSLDADQFQRKLNEDDFSRFAEILSEVCGFK